LLKDREVLDFIGNDEYHQHKENRFPKEDFEIPVKENQAFLLDDRDLRNDFKKRYEETASQYHKGQPAFEELLSIIELYAEKL